MFASVSRYAEPISQPCQLKVKVMILSLEFCVRSISPIPLEAFSLNFGYMFASVRRYAELIIQPCRHKVKVTDLRFEFRVGSVSPIPVEGFSLNFGQMFTLVRRCAELMSTMPTQGQGHRYEP